ncbi:hypothetical protein HGRIS_005462 [Hohenbuehelia grisea]|uniref:Uncharacterized protein n=1 Tax=Hohenbuehelia grisea TaxID=104357 RepID=A0ABR3JXT7_9AGAR
MEPRDLSEGPKRQRYSTDNALNASDLVLSALESATSVTEVPFISDTAELALSIVDTVQAVRDNKDAWKRLGCQVAELVAAIHAKAGIGVSGFLDDLQYTKQSFLTTLTSIQEVADKRRKRGVLKRIVASKSDVVVIERYKSQLRIALDIFGVGSFIANSERIAQIMDLQRETIAILRQLDNDMSENHEGLSHDQHLARDQPHDFSASPGAPPDPHAVPSPPYWSALPLTVEPVEHHLNTKLESEVKTYHDFVFLNSICVSPLHDSTTPNASEEISFNGQNLDVSFENPVLETQNIWSTDSGNVTNITTINSYNSYSTHSMWS